MPKRSVQGGPWLTALFSLLASRPTNWQEPPYKNAISLLVFQRHVSVCARCNSKRPVLLQQSKVPTSFEPHSEGFRHLPG